DKARQKTGQLVLYFALAVVCIFGALFILASFIFCRDSVSKTILWDPALAGIVALGTATIVGLGTLFKVISLAGGGKVVAEALGGKLLSHQTKDLPEKRFLNIVEEMALASGTPVPPSYIMEEAGINAFAAGYSPENAVIGVTRGCIEKLNREQLQGVVAHEFSHILNGDMSLNIRLIGVLAGILFIAVIGRILLEVGARSGGRRSRSKEGGGGAALLAIGLALFLVGYIGYFFGSLIKAAVSRQREFLADASAVQFTRNPGGIGGALRQIGGYADGELETKRATEVSHMCFSSVVNSFFSFKTHPPLPERISRIENLPLDDIGPGEAQASGAPLAAGAAGLAGGTIRTSAADVIASTGSVTEAGVEKASHIVASLPAGLAEAAQHPLSASALVYLLILPENKKERRKMVRTGLPGILGQDELGELSRLEKLMPGLDAHARLPLLEMTAPALRTLTKRQAEDFLKRIDEIIKFDTRVDLREFCYATMIDFCLHGSGKLRGRHKKRYRKIKELAPDFSRILSVLSDAGQDDSHARQRAFTAARKKLDGKVKLKYEAGGVEMTELRSSVGRLARSTLGIRKKALMACSHCVLADGIIEVEEAELLRAFAHALGIPVPPFLASTDLAGSDED
ncbi:MAG TPA: hypothetical protein DD471_01295, partial [Planctomycetes bacterium]|nr:hypothetical protein [Planctomycetota bacterium]